MGKEEILEIFRRNPSKGFTSEEINNLIKLSAGNIRKTLMKLWIEGDLDRERKTVGTGNIFAYTYFYKKPKSFKKFNKQIGNEGDFL